MATRLVRLLMGLMSTMMRQTERISSHAPSAGQTTGVTFQTTTHTRETNKMIGGSEGGLYRAEMALFAYKTP